MVAFVKVNGFVEHKNHGVHNLGTGQMKLALSNTPLASESPDPSILTADCILANVTTVSPANLVGGAAGLDVTTTTSVQTGGIYKLVLEDLTLTASGGAVGPFRYVYLYNDTPTSPADPLIGLWDYGVGGLTLNDGESLLVDFSEANGVLTDQ